MRKKALVIGVSKYDILDQLNFCKKDGQQVYDTLKMNGYEILADHILISDKLSFLDMHDTIIKFFKHSPTDAGDTLVFIFLVMLCLMRTLIYILHHQRQTQTYRVCGDSLLMNLQTR